MKNPIKNLFRKSKSVKKPIKNLSDEENQLFIEKVCENPNVEPKYKQYLVDILPAIDVDEIFIGDPRAFSGYEVLIIDARARGEIGFKMEFYSDLYYPNSTHNFSLVIGVNDEYKGAIELHNHHHDPVGFIDVNEKIRGGENSGYI